MSVCNVSLDGTEAACRTLWMRSVWSKDTSSRSPSSCSSSSWTLVAGESSTTWPFSKGSRGSRNPTPEKWAERKRQDWCLWDTSQPLMFTLTTTHHLTCNIWLLADAIFTCSLWAKNTLYKTGRLETVWLKSKVAMKLVDQLLFNWEIY